MSAQSDLGSGLSPVIAALLRLGAFIVLTVALVPVQIVYCRIKPGRPFRIPQLFHRLLLKILGFRVRVHGAVSPAAPVLFIANHSSYLDVPVLGALIPAAFVAKAEVADWPVIGSLARLHDTVFIERRSASINSQRNHLRERLAAGQNLVLFPEGTSSDGLTVLPFKSSLFSVVEETRDDIAITIQPVSIACTELDGLPLCRGWRPLYAWYGDMTLVGHLWNVFKLGHFTVDVVFHAPVMAGGFADRKALAAYCQLQVGRGIEQCLKGRGIAGDNRPQLPAPHEHEAALGAAT